MVKAYTQEHTYPHPWEVVTGASFRKFTDPQTQPTLSHILSVDTVSRSLNPDTGLLSVTRAITVAFPGPWFIRRIINQNICHCIESTLVDPRRRSMSLTSLNVSLRNFIEVEETTRYDPHPDRPQDWTVCKQQTSIRIKPIKALEAMAEKVEQKCAEKFQQNSAKGREVMERIYADTNTVLGSYMLSCSVV